jgi:hypothetical protein
MAVFKRKGLDIYYMKFMQDGKVIYKSCNTTDEVEAKALELIEKTKPITAKHIKRLERGNTFLIERRIARIQSIAA